MIGEFKKTLTVTKNEQRVISELLNTAENIFCLNFEKTPEDLVDIMLAISAQSPRAYLSLDKGTVDINYQNE